MRRLIILCGLLAGTAQAATPHPILDSYHQAARQEQPAFTPSPQRGKAFFQQAFTHNARMPGCTSCHTDDPRQPGQHVVTGKRIRPLASSAEPNRFSDAPKVEKWFGRNCQEVVGRACSAAEKADLVAYLSEVR